MAAHPIETHPRNRIFLRSTWFIRMLHNPMYLQIPLFVVLSVDVIRSEKENHSSQWNIFKYERIITADDIIGAISSSIVKNSDRMIILISSCSRRKWQFCRRVIQGFRNDSNTMVMILEDKFLKLIGQYRITVGFQLIFWVVLAINVAMRQIYANVMRCVNN